MGFHPDCSCLCLPILLPPQITLGRRDPAQLRKDFSLHYCWFRGSHSTSEPSPTSCKMKKSSWMFSETIAWNSVILEYLKMSFLFFFRVCVCAHAHLAFTTLLRVWIPTSPQTCTLNTQPLSHSPSPGCNVFIANEGLEDYKYGFEICSGLIHSPTCL